MKNRILTYNLLMLVSVSFFSCMEKTDKYAPKIQTAGTIQFVVADGALTGVLAFSLGLPVQPTMDVVAARFSRAKVASPNYFSGNVVITANLSANFTNLTINMYQQANPIRETKVSLTGISGTTTWTQAIATLQYNSLAVTNTNYILEFVASNADGTQTTIRTFTLTIIA